MPGELKDQLTTLVRQDRTESLRQLADDENTYCVFASLYEIASVINKKHLPPRVAQAEKEWLSFCDERKNGAVRIKDLLRTVVNVSNFLGVKIKKIIGNESSLNFLVKTLSVTNEDEDKEADHSDSQKTMHAESFSDSAGRWEKRRDYQLGQDRVAALGIIFDPKKRNFTKNNLDRLPMQKFVGDFNTKDPYMVIFVHNNEKMSESSPETSIKTN